MGSGVERDYYTEEEMAALLGLAPATMQKKRSLGEELPPYRKVLRSAQYPKKEFAKWRDAIPLVTTKKVS